MAKQLFTNNAVSQLSGTLPQGGTTLVCTAGHGSRFPTPSTDEYFYLTAYTKDAYANEQELEVIKVTARVGDVMTVERDIEGITGQTGGYAYNGSTTTVYLELRWTAGCIANLYQKDDLATVAVSGSYTDLKDKPEVSGSNTGDETASSIKTKLGITTLSGSNTGDQVIPTTLPASDVYAWAKEATKPSYTAAEVGAAALGANTFTGPQVFSDQPVSRAMLKDCGLVFLDKGNSGTTAQVLDYSVASHQKITVTGAHTISTANWPPSGNLGEILLELVNGASATLSFALAGTTMNWVKSDGSYSTTFAGSGVTLQSAGTDWLYMWSRDGGATVQIKVVR